MARAEVLQCEHCSYSVESGYAFACHVIENHPDKVAWEKVDGLVLPEVDRAD